LRGGGFAEEDKDRTKNERKMKKQENQDDNFRGDYGNENQTKWLNNLPERKKEEEKRTNNDIS
jgi:hypothetical protein